MFRFISYIAPAWYFNLKPIVNQGCFASPEYILTTAISSTLDRGYKSKNARDLDLSWNAFQAGLILESPQHAYDIWTVTEIPLVDEYRFIRKNFNFLWCAYVLILRIFTFHNPLVELMGFLKSLKVKRIRHQVNRMIHQDYEQFESSLLTQNPLVSIVIPTLNRYPWLREVFRDLEKQTYRNFEVIVVDQSQPFETSMYEGWTFPLLFWYQQEKALWKARNDAIRRAKGDYILLYDDDSRVDLDWIEQHVKALDYFQADISSGVSISSVGSKVPEHYAHFRWGEQLDTGNVLIRRSVFEQIGLFDRQFEKMRMGDGEFGLRAYLAGFRNISNPYARRLHLKISEGGLRQMGSWDAFRSKNVLAPKPIPSVLYLYRKYFGVRAALLAVCFQLPYSVIPYSLKKSKFLIPISFLIFLFSFPLLAWQLARSWSYSTKMVEQGARIPVLYPHT